ncbi:MAG TPA: hypothetical protein VG165_04205 [Solirubrobacteraceae bacterium]|nr:hypothetical protein [Solirubrobacteraceae bacterium]
MLSSIWFYRFLFAVASAAGLVLFAVNDPLTGLLVMLGGGGVIFLGGFVVAYRHDRSRGVLRVLAPHGGEFLRRIPQPVDAGGFASLSSGATAARCCTAGPHSGVP